MKALKIVLLLTILLTLANISGAQPRLTELNFLVAGQSVDTTSFADVTVQLEFDHRGIQTWGIQDWGARASVG